MRPRLDRVFLTLLLTLVSSVAQADLASFWENLLRPIPQTPPPHVVQIKAEEEGAYSMGSGTLIHVDGQYGWVLSNWHVVRGATGAIEVTFPSGFRSPAQVMKTDETWDLALLAIWQPPVAPMPLASETPTANTPITIGGYGQGQFRLAKGRVRNFASPKLGYPDELIDVTVRARQGDSGGPMINDRGELAGVLFGSGGGMTTGSHVGRVKQFLEEASRSASVASADPRNSAVRPTDDPGTAAGMLTAQGPPPFYPAQAAPTAPSTLGVLDPSAHTPRMPPGQPLPATFGSEAYVNTEPATTVANSGGTEWHRVERTSHHVDPKPPAIELPPDPGVDRTATAPLIDGQFDHSFETRAAAVVRGTDLPSAPNPLASSPSAPREELVQLPIPLGGTTALLAFLTLLGTTIAMAPRPRPKSGNGPKSKR
ncbi:MAG TPA: trypsin-like peptidase domain-containing protein [Pirellulaceae bacterium]